MWGAARSEDGRRARAGAPVPNTDNRDNSHVFAQEMQLETQPTLVCRGFQARASGAVQGADPAGGSWFPARFFFLLLITFCFC